MFGESFYNCFSRLKHPSHSTLPNILSSATTTTSATATASASSSSSGAVVFKDFKNFNSLYDSISDTETAITLALSASAPACSSFSSSSSCDCLDDDGGAAASPPSELELSTAIASRRLLLASPGHSNSIVDSAVVTVGVGKGLAVQTCSPDPYWEFRQSMEEMVAALGLDAADHRAHLHELLLCYLALNKKHVHKYIMDAFTDLLLSLSIVATDRASDA